MNKAALRTVYRDLRSAVSMSDVDTWSNQLANQLWSIPDILQARRIFAYLAMPKEANLDGFIAEALRRGIEVYVPVCINSKTMHAVRLHSLDEVDYGTLHIRIPKVPHVIKEAKDMDVVLIPGLAFDQRGGRLGMGAGYYDRYIDTVDRDKCWAVSWDFQIREETIPMNEYDIFMGHIVTPTQIIHCNSEKEEM